MYYVSSALTLQLVDRGALCEHPREKQVETLGVIFEAHIKNMTKTAFYHLRNVANVHPFLSLTALSQADLITAMLSCLAYPRKQLDSCKTYRMQQHF